MELPLWGGDQMSLHHFQEGFQSLANSKDLYLTADTACDSKFGGIGERVSMDHAIHKIRHRASQIPTISI